jgi:hypothetical protein
LNYDSESDNNDLENNSNFYINEFEKFINKEKKNMKTTDNYKLKIYNIDGLENLKMNLNETSLENNVINVNICAYIINKELDKPFLEYLLCKNNRELEFPQFIFDTKKNMNIKTQSIIELKNIIEKNIPSIKVCNNLDYKGYLFYKNEIYIFIDISIIDLTKNRKKEIVNNENIYFVIIDEIINYKKTYDVFINYKVTDFLYENIEYIFIVNVNNERIETPIICYIDKYETEIDYTINFGLMKSKKEDIVGPYYYFTCYDGAINKLEKTLLKNRKGIIRYVIFPEKMKVLLNYPGDNIDESIYKKDLVKNNINNLYDEKLTMRLSDYNCKWVEKYNSLFIGNIELDNGENIFKYPLWVIKNNNQFLNLSYKVIIDNKH